MVLGDRCAVSTRSVGWRLGDFPEISPHSQILPELKITNWQYTHMFSSVASKDTIRV